MNNNNKNSVSLAITPTKLWNNASDLAKCDQEQVRYPGAIMPHGALLVLDPVTYAIQGVSENATLWFKRSPKQLLGQRLNAVITKAAQQSIEKAMLKIVNQAAPAYLGSFEVLDSQGFDVFAHRTGNCLLLEFEAILKEDSAQLPPEMAHDLAASIAKLQQTASFQQAIFTAVQELKLLTGFDSVLAVRFLADGSGQTIAEACEPYFPSFFDKRFPASDVPEPARKQLLIIKQQYAPNLDYHPVPIVMAETYAQAEQLDLGYAMLRSVSPLCSHYYLNMGARSRFVLPLVMGGELWGFFAFLNAKVRPLNYDTRLACQNLAGVTLQWLVDMEKSTQNRNAYLLNHGISELSSGFGTADNFQAAIKKLPAQLLELFDLSGVVVFVDGQINSIGLVPSETMLKSLIPQLDSQEKLLATDHYPHLFGLDASYANQTAGLIALRLQEEGQYLLGFRLEWVHEVYWAGDPAKPVTVDATSGERRLTPRGSFEAWKEVVQGYARPWASHELDAMAELQKSLILLQLADREPATSLLRE